MIWHNLSSFNNAKCETEYVQQHHSVAQFIKCFEQRLHDLGFSTWYGGIIEISNCYGINLDIQVSKEEFKSILANHLLR